MSISSDARQQAALQAERALFQEYDLVMRERFIEAGSDRLRIRVLECGDPEGQPLVLVQGGLGEALGWASLLGQLRQFRCITLDRPGGGLSDGVDFTRVDIRRLAVDALEALLDSAEVDQAIFVGNSMGAWWSLQLAIDRPERVAGLVLAGCPALLLESAAPLPMRLMSLPLLGDRLVSSMVTTSASKARAIPGFLGHPKHVGERWSAAQAEAMHRFSQLPHFRRSWSTLLRRFLRLRGGNPELAISAQQLRTVKQPTLFLWGTGDNFGSADIGRAAVELMPHARLEVVGVGHLPWWDEPEACARFIRDFAAARGSNRRSWTATATPT